LTYKTYEAIIDEQGHVHLVEPLSLDRTTRALVIVLEGDQASTGETRTVIAGPVPPAAAPPVWSNRYKMLEPLAEGGMGKVVLAERLSDGARVCLKFLHERTDRRMFEQECRALLRLRHPSIIGLLDFSLDQTPPWMVTEYASGPTLEEYLKTHGALPEQEVIEILGSLLDALAYAHAQGVTHRDLKPANLILELEDGRPRARVLDFGIALVDDFDFLDNATAQGSAPLGTLLYMSPEQIRGEFLTPACDTYAAGLIAWEMLTGKPAFVARTAAELIYQKTTSKGGRALEQTAAPVSSELGKWIEACTRADPATRPTAKAGLDMLGKLRF
jgi:serine/threonine protein kinase